MVRPREQELLTSAGQRTKGGSGNAPLGKPLRRCRKTSATGASIGLVAVVLGALFNAHLRREEHRVLAGALSVELSQIRDTLSAVRLVSLLLGTSFPLKGYGVGITFTLEVILAKASLAKGFPLR